MIEQLPRRAEGGFGRRFAASLGVVIILLAAIAAPLTSRSRAGAAAPSDYFVNATGHTLADPFLTAWIKRNGLSILGLPVTEPTIQNGRVAQFFEYGYLRAAPGVDASRLVLRPAGEELLHRAQPAELTAAGRRAGGVRAAGAFQTDGETAFEITGRIESFYIRHGGAERFGEAISESYVTGGMRVQWFERGRLQWRLDVGVVEAAPVGFELAHALGVDTKPVARDGRALFQEKRFRVFEGDGTIPEAAGTFSPVRIAIPSIKIDAKIEQIGITDGVMDSPQDVWAVGWYKNLAKPGERTNVVMAGHKDWWNVGPVVFWNLEQVTNGDKIYLVGKNGKGATYVVTEAWSIDADTDAGPIIGDAGAETLTLITCGGNFNGVEYLERRIVRAERI